MQVQVRGKVVSKNRWISPDGMIPFLLIDDFTMVIVGLRLIAVLLPMIGMEGLRRLIWFF